MSTNINESENFFNIDFFSHPKSNSADNIRTNSLSVFSSQMNLEEIDMKDFLINVKTHQGSISYQYILNGLTPEEINSLLLKLCPYLVEIMCSHYGNYFIQKLFLKLNVNQRLLVFLVSNRFGCNVILFMIEKYGVGYSGFIFNEIKQNLIYFSTNNINSVSLVIKVINYMSKYDKLIL